MDFRSLSQIIQPLVLSVWFPLLIKGNPCPNKRYWWNNSLAGLLINTTQLVVYNVSGPDTNLLQKSLRISSMCKVPLCFPIRDFEEELSLTAQGRAAIRCHIVCAAIFYIQYSSHWFLLIKNLSSQSPLVTEKSFTFPLRYEGCVSRGLIFQSLVIHLWWVLVVTGGKKKVFEKEQQPCRCWCFHSCVCQWRGEGSGKDNSLNNTTNYTATSFLGVGRTDLNIYYLHKCLVT